MSCASYSHRDSLEEGRVYCSCELDEKRISDVVRDLGDVCILYASDIPHAHRVFDAVRQFRKRTDIAKSKKNESSEKTVRGFFRKVGDLIHKPSLMLAEQ